MIILLSELVRVLSHLVTDMITATNDIHSVANVMAIVQLKIFR